MPALLRHPQHLLLGLALLAATAAGLACSSGETSGNTAPHPKEITVEVMSDAFRLDRIFKSMRGPLTTREVIVGDTFEPELVWLTGYTVDTLAPDRETLDSLDYVCHTNLNWDNEKRPRWAHRPRPRIFVLTQGQTDVRLPNGFGIPMLSSEKLVFNSQLLNLNEPEIDRTIIHRAQVHYVRDEDVSEPMKPLIFAGAQGLVSLDDEAHVWNVESPDELMAGASCGLGEHAGARDINVVSDSFENRFSPHWIVPPGRHEYRTLVTEQLGIPYDTKVHFIGVHVHPHSESLELRDLTTGETIFKSEHRNHADRLGLDHVDYFSSEAGIPIYKGHQYELISVYDNATERAGDAMAGMYLYYLDKNFKASTARPRIAQGDSTPTGS